MCHLTECGVPSAADVSVGWVLMRRRAQRPDIQMSGPAMIGVSSGG